MRVHHLLKRRVALVAVAAAIALGASACGFANTSATPPTDAVQNGVLQAMNADRQANGVPPLQWSPKLANTAGNWAANESRVNSMYHQDLSALLYSPDYAGWYTLGENLLVGPGGMSVAQMEQAWMNSPAHRANILNRSFNAAGVGYVRGPDGRLWTVVDFGGV
ncbi:MAG: CAP domain-containing protein [Acidimicrobiia bacterium]